jgi:lipid A 3-O-deacylase
MRAGALGNDKEIRMKLRNGAAAIAVLTVAAAGQARAQLGILDEMKIGLLDHDAPIGADHREPGIDANGEVLFVSPGFRAPIWAPRPDVGVNINSAGKNSYAYAGLTWTANFSPVCFGDLSVGGAIHDGPNAVATTQQDHKGLGTRLLFHESVELGYRFTAQWSLAAFIDHVSNAGLGGHNPGITNVGGRVGYKF